MKPFNNFIKEQDQAQEWVVDFETVSDMARWQQDHPDDEYKVDDEELTLTYITRDEGEIAMLKDMAPDYNATVMKVETDDEEFVDDIEVDPDNAVNEELFQDLFAKAAKQVNKQEYQQALNDLITLLKRKMNRFGELPHSLDYYAQQIGKSYEHVDWKELMKDFEAIGGNKIFQTGEVPWQDINFDAVRDREMKHALQALVQDLEREFEKTGEIPRRIGGLVTKTAKQYPNVNPKQLANTYYDLVPESVQMNEEAPPSKKAEEWIKSNKDKFRNQYGDDWEEKLYATAWKLYNDGTLKENLDESDAPTTTTGGVANPDAQPMFKRTKEFGKYCLEMDADSYHNLVKGKKSKARWKKYLADSDPDFADFVKRNYYRYDELLMKNKDSGAIARLK